MKAMSYEKTPIRPFLFKRPITRNTNDLTKLSTLVILGRLYKRHERILLEVALACTWVFVIVKSV